MRIELGLIALAATLVTSLTAPTPQFGYTTGGDDGNDGHLDDKHKKKKDKDDKPGSQNPAQAPSPGPSSASGGSSSSCTFTSASDLQEGKLRCSRIVLSGITVPPKTTLNLTDLQQGTEVLFEGTTTFEFHPWNGPLIYIGRSSRLRISGAPGHVIDGNGPKWWDGLGSNGGIEKPRFMHIDAVGLSEFDGLNVKNTPVHAIVIDHSSDLFFNNVLVDDSEGDTGGGHNTDGFDVHASRNLTFQSITVKNQDDCVAISSGNGIYVRNATCLNGHGMSLGEFVGGSTDENRCENIRFEDSFIGESRNGLRIKTRSGTTGVVQNIYFTNITMRNISTYGFDIQQDYMNGAPTGKPTNGVQIKNVNAQSIHGTVENNATGIYILCGSNSCSNWTVSDISITGGRQGYCLNPPTDNSSLGTGLGRRGSMSTGASSIFSLACTEDTQKPTSPQTTNNTRPHEKKPKTKKPTGKIPSRYPPSGKKQPKNKQGKKNNQQNPVSPPTGSVE